MPDVAHCRSCNARIIWTKGSTGRANPVDAEPSEKGNIQILAEGTAVYLKADEAEAARQRGEKLHLSHFATCPNAAKHRKK